MFLDKYGQPILPGNTIEYWGTEKEWIVAKVLSVSNLTELNWRTQDLISKTSIKVKVDMQANPTRSHYSHPIKLSKSANIRKVK